MMKELKITFIRPDIKKPYVQVVVIQDDQVVADVTLHTDLVDEMKMAASGVDTLIKAFVQGSSGPIGRR